MASVAAGTKNNDIGVGPSSNIIAIQVFSSDSNASDCGSEWAPCALSYDSDWIKGLERVYALRNTYKIASVNMSLGGGSFSGTCDSQNPAAASAIAQLRNANIAVLIAAGNAGLFGSIQYPACISSAIAVASDTLPPNEGISSFSNYSQQVQLVAPGSNIYAAIPPSGYDTRSGTSFATPHVTGAFSVLSGVNTSATSNDILAALVCTGKMDIRNGLAKPRIDLVGAYNRLKLPAHITWASNFSTSAGASDFTPFLGSWTVTNGAYAQTPIKQGWIGTSRDNCDASEIITATMT